MDPYCYTFFRFCLLLDAEPACVILTLLEIFGFFSLQVLHKEAIESRDNPPLKFKPTSP